MKQKTIPYRSTSIRFIVLFLASMIVVGNQYAFNNPQALQNSLEKQLNIGQTQFQLFYSVFSFPNIFATFIMGFLIDFLGVRVGLITLTIGITLSQAIIALGGYMYSYKLMIIGRVFFGITSQSLITAQACLISIWFKGKQLAFALGLAITFPELGNALNSYLSPLIYEKTNSIGAPLLFSVFICFLSLICSISAAVLDKRAENNDKILNNLSVSQEEIQKINFKDIKKLNISFWLIVTLCMFAVGLYVPFMDGANRLFQIRFCFTQITSGKAIMITYIIAFICSAPLGYAIDKIGFKRYFIISAFVIYIIAQTFILFYPQCQPLQQNGSVIGLIFLGLGYSFYGNCIVPTIPLVVEKNITGTAFGIMQMIESIGLAFLPLIGGSLVETASTIQVGYIRYSIFFVCIGFIGLLVSFGLFYIPQNMKQILDKGNSSQTSVKTIYNETSVNNQYHEETDVQFEILQSKQKAIIIPIASYTQLTDVNQ